MTKPFSLSKTDMVHWVRAFVAYSFGGLLVGVGVTLEHINLGIWTYILIALGGALADLGRRFITDTQNQLVSETKVTTTITSTDPPPVPIKAE